MEFTLRQTGRASIDFAADLAAHVGRLRPRVLAELARQGFDEERLAPQLDQRLRQVDEALKDCDAFAALGVISEWSSVNHGRFGAAAFEECRAQLEPQLRALQQRGPSRLEPAPGGSSAPYSEGVWIHRTTGGWDGHEFQGFIHGEIVHKAYVARNWPGDIFAQRRQVLDELPRRDYQRILEIGTSSGHYTLQIARAFPDAEIWGIDPSQRMLEQAQRTANEHGYAWHLLHGVGEHTGLPDAEFDLVTAYIVMHEVPAQVTREQLREALRLLRPGGEILFADVPRYATQTRLDVFWAEYGAINGGEPFWRDAAGLDLQEAARAAGFVEVRSCGVAGRPYPWYVYGRKPP